jgi:PKD repeat protein
MNSGQRQSANVNCPLLWETGRSQLCWMPARPARRVVAAGLLLGGLAAAGCGGEQPSPGNTPKRAAPTAAFTVSPALPASNQAVQFSDASTGNPTSWLWTFGDGGTDSTQNPSHTYGAAGTFLVSLTVSNAEGSNTATRGVVVEPVTPTDLSILLGRPSDRSVIASVLADPGTDVFFEYGTTPGMGTSQTATGTASAGDPVVIALTGLNADTPYYYRAWHRSLAETHFRADSEHSFHTKRSSGGAFTFVVQADPHLDDNSSTAVYSQTLRNELADRPDFMIDLGDTSMVEKCAIEGSALCATPAPGTFAAVQSRNAMMRSYFDLVCHSIPLFLVLGNHDGELGWLSDGTTSSLDVLAVAARKRFFANPEPDDFYTGDDQRFPGIGLRQNYYAFEWGDALFVMLDPFTYTTVKPGRDAWNWTLGATQYQWLARTLAASRARFKFVFSHHMLGGNGSDARGGAAFAQFFEWGGRDLDGTWAFDKQRPGWPAPIQRLLVDNKVTAWFHGHDHLYAKESIDGVVYQEVPQPSLARYDMPDPGSGYGYQGTVGVDVFPSSGHLRVSVGAAEVRVEYVRSVAPADETSTRKNGSIITSYVMK